MKIAVTSPSFSSHPDLIQAMKDNFQDYKLNTEGKRFTQEELIDYLQGYDAAIVGLEEMNKTVIDALPNLQFISKYGVGLNNIDLDYCKEKSIGIGWTGGVNRLSVAEMVVGNAISLLRNLYVSSNRIKNGQWIKNGGQQLSGKTVGIIGVGHIGKELIRLLAPFNCTILVNDIIEQSDYYASIGAKECTKQEIFAQADLITLHVPYTDLTKNLINAEALKLMHEHTIVINTARGGIVNEEDLCEALKSGQIGGAALDVFVEEPVNYPELIAQPNFIATPHIGGNAKEAVLAMGMSAIEHLINQSK